MVDDLPGREGTATTDREQVTDLLLRLRHGESGAMDQLFPLVYDEVCLERFAAAQLALEAGPVTTARRAAADIGRFGPRAPPVPTATRQHARMS